MIIEPKHEQLQYQGRIDFTNQKAPVWVFPCTSVRMRFTGSYVKVILENHRSCWDNYMGYILDGMQGKILLAESGKAAYGIESHMEDKEHELLLFKRMDSCHAVTFYGFEIEDGAQILPGEELPARKIEVYGDSVSAGEVSEAVEYVGKEDPEHNGEYSNSWYSYAWMTARRLNAQIHDIAQGGIALMDQTGWFHDPDYIGMETAWDKIHYHPDLAEPMDWDFSQYIPQVVVVAVGQNDSHPEDYMKEKSDGEKAERWRNHYKAFLRNLREKYPSAHIVCCTTLLVHDEAWDGAIGQAVGELGDERITQYLFKRNGKGTPGHLRIPEAEEMAEELAGYIESLSIGGWI